ncbi:transposase [Xylella taiwanensis]|uniref:transposase n=1 Tax=Xylella taiwanensis TaxID=1444770 RepID=UPI00135F1AD1|nr:transposase [Xylella taiwanensis]MCD8457124.1 transposase [Xylella taiwanensis]UFN41757.1 transposase [Xylella taiwanensis]UFS49909.1 transposase [Xylella taiwanensis]UFS52195.1 transposase [Xylella taiwanensis]
MFNRKCCLVAIYVNLIAKSGYCLDQVLVDHGLLTLMVPKQCPCGSERLEIAVQVEHCFLDILLKQCGNVSPTHLQVLDAILYLAEYDCTWGDLPKRFDHWQTIYTGMNRWVKPAVLNQPFEPLQQAQVVQIDSQTMLLDSMRVKVPPESTGTPQKTVRWLSRHIPWWEEHQAPPLHQGRAIHRMFCCVA